jgi:hypothetical protein
LHLKADAIVTSRYLPSSKEHPPRRQFRGEITTVADSALLLP